MILNLPALPAGKKIYFASDFHLGAPNPQVSLERERRIIRWLDSVSNTAAHIFLVGDLFDFWYEYNYVIPKGFIRFQGKLAELVDRQIPLSIFTGNHDIWAFRYFTDELGIPLYRKPQVLQIGTQRILLGHGDGLGRGDYFYKYLLKNLFENPIAQFLFSKIHPSFTFPFALLWAKYRKNKDRRKGEEHLKSREKEWIWQYCEERETKEHFDFYVFGHRHLPLDLPVGTQSRYINLGEWLNYDSYAEYDGKTVTLKAFEKPLILNP